MDVVVVGAGLAGLTAADALHRGGATVTVVEARGWVGGRMMTVVPEGLDEGACFDVGATWLWSDQPRIRALAQDLGLDTFAQYRTGKAVVNESTADVPPPSPAELRLVGGTQGLCRRLADLLPEGSVRLNTTVVAVEDHSPGVHVSVVDGDDQGFDIEADYVVMALPPRLLLDNVAFTPDLPEDLVDVMSGTDTWMATALKCVAVYETPFWREAGLSGLAFSDSGPLREVHDACTQDGSAAGLWGFISGAHEYRDLSFDDRLPLVFEQLGRMFGPLAADPLRYFERDWSNDPLTNDEVFSMDHHEYGHPLFTRPEFGGRLLWAGTETATEGAGHMEGAVQSGQRAAEVILTGGP